MKESQMLAILAVFAWIGPWVAGSEREPWAKHVRIIGALFMVPLIVRLWIGAIFN